MDEREIKLDNPDKLVLAGGVVTVKLDAGEVQEIVLAEMGRRGFTVTSPINAVYGSSRDDDCYCEGVEAYHVPGLGVLGQHMAEDLFAGPVHPELDIICPHSILCFSGDRYNPLSRMKIVENSLKGTAIPPTAKARGLPCRQGS